MSAFMVSSHLMQKVVTAVLQNTDEFVTIQTFRGQLVDDPPTDAQRRAAHDIGKRLFGMNAAAIKARYGTLPQRPAFKFAGWADATPVEQFKAIRCLLYQAWQGTVPKGQLYGELNRVAGELAQRIVQDSPEYEKAPRAECRRAYVLPACRARRPGKHLAPNGEADMKWKIRLARDMAQEAFVVIEALTREEAEAILWHDMDPEVIRWSNDDVMGDREVIEICPAGDKDQVTPLKLLPAQQPEELRTYRVSWVIEVEADTPLIAARRARFCQTQPGTVALEVCEVRVCAAQRYGPPVTIDLTPDGN